jgi:hypothetical protein
MKPKSELSTQEVLAGLVERVTFHNTENGFCVLRAKARGRHCREGRKRRQSIGGDRTAAHIDARCKLEVPRGPAYAMLRGVGLRFVKVGTLPHGS